MARGDGTSRPWLRLLRGMWRESRGSLLLWGLGTLLVSIGTWAQTELLKQVVDHLMGTAAATTTVHGLAAAAVLFALLRGFGAYWQMVTLSVAGTQAVSRLQKQVVARLIDADLAYLQSRVSTGIVTQVQRDTLLVQNMVGPGLGAMGRDGVTVLALAAWMVWVDWRLSVLTAIGALLGMLPVRLLGKRASQHSSRLNVEITHMAARLGQLLQGIRQVKTYRMETVEVARAWAAMDRTTDAYAGEIRVHALSAPLLEMVGGIGLAALILLAGMNLPGLGPGTLVTFTSGFVAISLVLRRLAAAQVARRNADAALVRLFDLVDQAPIIRELPEALPLQVTGGAIRFEGVGYRHDGGPVLFDHLDLEIPAGSTVGLVGLSGAGKSTLLNLILRFHDPQTGRILIDGVDIRGVKLSSLRSQVTLVGQEAMLFDDTIRANIACGHPDADMNDITAAIHAVKLQDFIADCPQGDETPVGEGGARLSGGQRQRVALARAVLKGAPILLLDEATAALDAETERSVTEFLRDFAYGRTTVIVAHQLRLVMGADKICVLDGGRIVEQGNHAELLAQGGLYALLWKKQGGGN